MYVSYELIQNISSYFAFQINHTDPDLKWSLKVLTDVDQQTHTNQLFILSRVNNKICLLKYVQVAYKYRIVKVREPV